MAIIINYTGGFVNLVENVIRALRAAEKGITHSLLTFRSYSIARKHFFADYAYVICLTGPTGGHRGELTMPDDFGACQVAARLLSLAEKWAYLYRKRFTVSFRNRD
jgi:hypothetical protein